MLAVEREQAVVEHESEAEAPDAGVAVVPVLIQNTNADAAAPILEASPAADRRDTACADPDVVAGNEAVRPWVGRLGMRIRRQHGNGNDEDESGSDRAHVHSHLSEEMIMDESTAIYHADGSGGH